MTTERFASHTESEILFDIGTRRLLTEYNCSGFTGDTGSYSLSVFYIPFAFGSGNIEHRQGI